MHTAAWDSSMQLAGKKVAVVGTGASAIQVIPHLQQVAAQLVVFQVRTFTCDWACRVLSSPRLSLVCVQFNSRL
jgi:glutamyl-tRNA reductase